MAERSEAAEDQAVRDASAAYSVETDIATTEDVPPGYKRTEAGVLPSEWEVSSVGEEFTLQLGKMLDSAKNTGDPKPYIGNRAVQWGRVDLEEVSSVRMKRSELKRYRVDKGDLLVCEGGEIGRSAIWNAPIPECYYQKALHRLRPKRGYSPFLMMSFLNLWASSGMLANFVTQTSIAHLPKDKLELVPLPVPTPDEQRAIATALSDADALIESLDRLIAKKRAIKKAAMQQLLTGQTRLPGFTGEWETKRLGDISTIAMGRTPSRNNTAFWGRGHVWLSIADLHGKVVKESKEQITDLAAAGMTPIPEGTLLMSFKLSIGRLCFAGCDLFTNEAICSFTDLQADEEFIYYALSRTDFSLYGKQAVKGYTLNSESLKLVEVFLPPEDEQTAIATVLSDMDTEIEALDRRRDKARQTKQGMMQQLLTGRVRLVAPEVAA